MTGADAGAPGTPHRREDGEGVGWIAPAGDLWQAIDILGRPVGEPTEWLDAEAALEERGLAWLADPWMLEGVSDRPLRVRIVETSPRRVVVKTDDFGDMTASVQSYTLPWPAPASLRPALPSDPDPREV